MPRKRLAHHHRKDSPLTKVHHPERPRVNRRQVHEAAIQAQLRRSIRVARHLQGMHGQQQQVMRWRTRAQHHRTQAWLPSSRRAGAGRAQPVDSQAAENLNPANPDAALTSGRGQRKGALLLAARPKHPWLSGSTDMSTAGLPGLGSAAAAAAATSADVAFPVCRGIWHTRMER